MTWSNHGCFDLRGVNLTAANLRGAVFRDTILDSSLFRAANLVDSDFQGVISCRDTNFEGAVLTHANLQSIDAIRANFDRANLHEASLDEAFLEDATFVGADMRDSKLLSASAARADFSGARLAEADFSSAYLVGAVFHGANVSFANFGYSNLRGASFDGAHGVDLADFYQAQQ